MSENERLASVEVKLEIILETIRELKDDLKSTPSRNEFEDLKARLNETEKNQSKLVWKVASIAGSLTVLLNLITAFLQSMGKS